jgi:hypothetical protein
MSKLALAAVLATLVAGGTKEVKAAYYPDRSDLTHHLSAIVASADECRAWVSQQAARRLLINPVFGLIFLNVT